MVVSRSSSVSSYLTASAHPDEHSEVKVETTEGEQKTQRKSLHFSGREHFVGEDVTLHHGADGEER
jgi:hypothetical protein